MHISPSILSTVISLLVTIGPIETAVVFAGLTAGIHRSERISLASRSVTIAAGVLLLFAVAGGVVLSLLHIMRGNPTHPRLADEQGGEPPERATENIA